MPHEWYVEHRGTISGPYSAATLKAMVKSGEVARNDIVRGGPDGRALLAAEILEFVDLSGAKSKLTIAPPAAPNARSGQGNVRAGQAESVPPPLPVKRPASDPAAEPSDKAGNAFSFASLALATAALALLFTPNLAFAGLLPVAFILALAGLILAMTGTGYSSLRRGDFLYAAVGLVLNGIGAVVGLIALGLPVSWTSPRPSAAVADVNQVANRSDSSPAASAPFLPDARVFAEPGAALIASEGVVWTLEGKSLKEAQVILASDEVRDLQKSRGTSPDVSGRESALRNVLRTRRSDSTLVAGRAFLEGCNRRSRQWLTETSSKLQTRPEDFVVEWLTYEGALDFGMMTHIWNQQGSFRGEAATIVESFLDGVSEPPSAEKGVEIQSFAPGRVVVSLFGTKVVEELIDKPAKAAGDQATVWWKSNYDYLRRILKGTPAKPVIDEVLERENNRYNVDYVEWFQE